MKNLRFKKILGLVFFLLLSLGFAQEKTRVLIDSSPEKTESVIAERIKELNKNPDLEIYLLKDDGEFLEFKDRKKRIEQINPDVFISLYTGVDRTGKGNGFEILIPQEPQNQEASRKIALRIAQKYPRKIQNQGINEKNYYLLQNTICPSVFIQLGFLSNQKDREYLQSKSGQDEIASKILKAII